MKKLLVVLAAALATAAIAVTPAFAATSLPWANTNSSVLPCSGNEHWILSGNTQGVTGATLLLDGSPIGTFMKSGNGSWSVDTNLGVDGSENITASVEGTVADSTHLVLSHCVSEQTTTTTEGPTTTTEGPTTTTEGPTTTTTTTTEGPTTTTEGPTGTTAGPTTTTGTGGVLGSTTGGTTGGTAPSGGNLPFTGLPIWIPLLAAAALLASGVVLIRRKRTDLS